MPSFRRAVKDDIRSIKAIDQTFATIQDRENFIETAVSEGRAYVLLLNTQIIGYGVLHHHFFGRSFLDMVYIAESHRKMGYGARILKEMEQLSASGKIFTSTNQSNSTMRYVLNREGWRETGHIENLDENDPEIVYFKLLQTE